MTRIAMATLGLLAAFGLFAALLSWAFMLVRGNPNINPIWFFLIFGVVYTVIILFGMSRWPSAPDR